MKIITLPTLLLSLMLSSPAWAQTTDPIRTATDMTREMSNRLHLNEGQFVKLFSLNRTRLTRQQEIERGTQHDPAGRTAQLAELQSQYEQECSRILSASQLSQLLQPDANPTTDGSNG